MSDNSTNMVPANDNGTQPKKPRGFAAMDRKLVSELASKGGKAAHASGKAHEFTSEEAFAAGRKGGMASQARRAALRAGKQVA